jgi:branched-subunit amino acid aminotransferase/4-amino-4-deoxychorismate lyase
MAETWPSRAPAAILHLQARGADQDSLRMTLIWCNGQWLEPSDFRIAPTDRGLMHGLGLFETILAVDGHPVFAERHLARLALGCQRLGWPFGFPDARQTMAELAARNGFTSGRSRIRLNVTAGSGVMGDLTPGDDRLILMTAARAAEPPATTTANLSPFVRNERSAFAGLKSNSYAENPVALDHARRLGFEETVFLNTAGNLCEAATSNLFLVRNGTLLTPSPASGCLQGITRAVVIELAARLDIPCEEAALPAALIDEADEVFLTSSIRGVMGVSRFEQRALPAGPLTGQLRLAWNGEVHRECGE